MADKRKSNRRPFTHYLPVLHEPTGRVIGYLSDISLEGFKLDCSQRLPVGHDFARIERPTKSVVVDG